MPKANGKRKAPETAEAIQTGQKQKYLYNLFPWTFRPMPGGILIEAYVEAAGDWHIVAEVTQTAFLDAEKTAAYIVKCVNHHERQQGLIKELVNALKLTLECKGITWEVEQEAESVLRKFNQYSPQE